MTAYILLKVEKQYNNQSSKDFLQDFYDTVNDFESFQVNEFNSDTEILEFLEMELHHGGYAEDNTNPHFKSLKDFDLTTDDLFNSFIIEIEGDISDYELHNNLEQFGQCTLLKRI